MQDLIVALAVTLCALYAAWKLMPGAARRSLAAGLLRVPHLPDALAVRLRRQATAASGCGCDGCDHGSAKRAAAPGAAGAGRAGDVQPIAIHRRPSR